MKAYHIGLEDAGKRPYGYTQKPGLLIVHAEKSIDNLPPYLWEYLGIRETTKKALKERIMGNISGFLAMIKENTGKQFTAVKVV